MSNVTSDSDRPPLIELFDERGRQWLGEVLELVKDGAYTEQLQEFRADEAGKPGALDDE